MSEQKRVFLVASEGGTLRKVQAKNSNEAIRIWFANEKQCAHPTTVYAWPLDRVQPYEASWGKHITLKPLEVQRE